VGVGGVAELFLEELELDCEERVLPFLQEGFLLELGLQLQNGVRELVVVGVLATPTSTDSIDIRKLLIPHPTHPIHPTRPKCNVRSCRVGFRHFSEREQLHISEGSLILPFLL
jgi:hypothetical protein